MKINWRSSLRTKIIGWSFIPTVIILSAVAWFILYSYQKLLVDMDVKQDWAVVESKAVKAGAAISRMVEPLLLQIAMDIDIDYDQPVEVRAQNILDQANHLDIPDGGIYFIDKQGKVFKTQPEQPELLGQDWSNTPAFRYMQDHRNTTPFTDLQSIGGNEIVCVSWPMTRQQGEFVGAGYYCFTVQPTLQHTLYKTLNSLDLGPGVSILDGNQHIIYSQDPSEIGKDLSKERYIQQLLQEKNRSGQFQKGTETMVISYYPVNHVVNDQMRWILIKEQSWSDIVEPSLPYRQFLFILLALGVIVPVLVTAYGVKHITNPIQKLIVASEQVTAGQFKHRMDVKTGDEFEILANQFNLMSSELDESYSSLEKKVTDRTRGLAIMNSILSVASHSLDIQEILEDALNKTVEQMGFECGAVYKLEANTDPSHLVAYRGFERETALDLVNIDPIKSQVNLVDHPSTVTGIDINDLRDDQLRSQFAGSDCQRIIFVPISTKGRSLGFFLLGGCEPKQFSPEEHSLLTSIGQQIGVAIENARLYEQVEQSTLLEERSRLARELHDSVTQSLYSVTLYAEAVARLLEGGDTQTAIANLRELRDTSKEALRDMRLLIYELRPPLLETGGLTGAFQSRLDAVERRAGLHTELKVDGKDCLSATMQEELYQIAREALNNLLKHAKAHNVRIYLSFHETGTLLEICDDGIGFAPDQVQTSGGLGIFGMRERAQRIGAHLEIHSTPGKGTTVRVSAGGNRVTDTGMQRRE